MKLYNEEQVRKAIHIKSNNIDLLTSDEILSKLTPIKLPSDEEIEDKIEDSAYSIEYDYGLRMGAKWVIGHIKQEDNG